MAMAVSQAAWGVVTAVVTVTGSYLVGRLGARGEQRKAELAAKIEDRKAADAGDVSAGELALKIAKEAQDSAEAAQQETRALHRWRRSVERWWNQHNRVDQAVLEELERLDPSAVTHLPALPPLPVYEENGNNQPRRRPLGG